MNSQKRKNTIYRGWQIWISFDNKKGETFCKVTHGTCNKESRIFDECQVCGDPFPAEEFLMYIKMLIIRDGETPRLIYAERRLRNYCEQKTRTRTARPSSKNG